MCLVLDGLPGCLCNTGYTESELTCVQVLCGDGLCNGNETGSSCSADCYECGDLNCSLSENAGSCPQDCLPRCGDGHCSHGENYVYCEEDCDDVCGNDICGPDELVDSCPEDCPEGMCGNHVCELDENDWPCPEDCDDSCGDGICDDHEIEQESCQSDCQYHCGDGGCSTTESALTCPEDCPPICGDRFCSDYETSSSCPEDCPLCGDGTCAYGESSGPCGTCPEDCSESAEWIGVCAGVYTIGSPETEIGREEDEMQHNVLLDHDFVMASTEVTARRFFEVTGACLDSFEDCDGYLPGEYITWFQSAYFCNKLSELWGFEICYECHPDDAFPAEMYCMPYLEPRDCEGYRLPTAVEWEIAARAGRATATYNGDLPADIVGCDNPIPILDEIAWYQCNSDGQVHEVGELEPNEWGLYDMLGNVAEWCHPAEDLLFPVRGGSWHSFPTEVRAAAAVNIEGGDGEYGIGFRPVRTLD